jgi:hypothetical protein
MNRVDCVMVSVLATIVVDPELTLPSGQTKDYEIGICCFYAKHAAVRGKNKYWVARNQIDVSEWSDMSVHGQLFK